MSERRAPVASASWSRTCPWPPAGPHTSDRPADHCLEDLLQPLVEEFRFDAMPNALQVIEDGRVKWRRRQLAAMVRDDPEEAVRVLTDELGYEVKLPTSGARGVRFDRLRRW